MQKERKISRQEERYEERKKIHRMKENKQKEKNICRRKEGYVKRKHICRKKKIYVERKKYSEVARKKCRKKMTDDEREIRNKELLKERL